MWNEPTPEELRRIPSLYATEERRTREIEIYMHFFLGASDWYMAEYDKKDRLFFGYTILNGDLENAEWGYTSYDELRDLRTRQGFEVDRDLYWVTKKTTEIENIPTDID